MIVLFHEVFLLLRSVIKWLQQKTSDEDHVDGGSSLQQKNTDEDHIVAELFKQETVEQLESSPLNKNYIKEFSLLDKNDKTIDFPFFHDKDTISYIRKAKTMFIMRGVSGSGKSTLVKLICDVYKDVTVCSADQYFVKNGRYDFDHTQLSVAHDECNDKAKKACLNGVPVVVIDNTNVKRWEMTAYLDIAFRNNYPVIIVMPKTTWSNNPIKLAELNKHGVMADVILNKLKSFEDVTPLYYGWFFNEKDSNLLYELGRNSLKECVQIYPQLKEMLLLPSSDNLEQTLFDYFKLKRSTILHCTAKFMGTKRNPAENSEKYINMDVVQRSYGSVHDLTVTRITVTPRTIGVKVKLSEKCLQLYDKPEERDRGMKLKLQMGDNSLELEFGRSSHVTIGTAPDIPPVTTNDDLLDILDREVYCKMHNIPLPAHKCALGTVQHVLDDSFVVNLSQPITMQGLFTGFYGGRFGSPRN